MNLENPVIAIIGAGAVGGYYGARLAHAGYQVHFHMRSDASHVRQSGIKIQSKDGDFSLPPDRIRAHEHPATMPKADLIVVTLKTTANNQLPELLQPIVKDDSAILTLQNGLGNEELLAENFGAHRVLGGMAFVCINRLAPGHISHTDHGMIQLAEFSTPQGDSPRARRIAEIFSKSNVHCATIPNLIYGRWEKLLWNIPFNGLGALLDLSTDRLINSEPGLYLVRQLMADVQTAAASLGVRFPPDLIQKKIDYTRTMGPYKTSTQIDRHKNRPFELDAIWGKPLTAAKRAAAATPALEILYNNLLLIDPGSKFP
jgi:2-dehydropantoate 2-reductase